MPTSLAQWCNAIIRHRALAVTAFLTVLLLTGGVIVLAPRVYKSTSRLLLRIGHENATLEPTVAVTGEAFTPLHTREDEVETALGVMQSRAIMEQVVAQLGVDTILDEQPPQEVTSVPQDKGVLGRVVQRLAALVPRLDPVSDQELAVRTLQRGFEISASGKSSVVAVSYEAKDPAVAQQIVSAWVDNYLAHHLEVHRTQGTFEFFVTQEAELSERLGRAHEALREAKSRGGFSTLEGQQQLLESQLQTVRNELLRVQADLAEAGSQITAVGDLLETSVASKTTEEVTGIADPAQREMRGVLFELEVLEQEYAAKYKDGHPKLVAIRDQLENAKKIVDSLSDQRTELRESDNPTYRQLSENRLLAMASQQSLQEKRKTLQQQQAELLEEMKQLNEHEARLAKLTREVTMLEERYRLHAVRFEQARLDKVLGEERISSINVVQPASFEELPVSPNKKLSALFGLFAALALAASLPVLLDVREAGDAAPEQGRQTAGASRRAAEESREREPARRELETEWGDEPSPAEAPAGGETSPLHPR